jgi:hypothetical protein
MTSATSSGFEAVAVRSGSSAWSGELTIDDTGLVSGALKSAGKADVVPGFQ